MQYSLKSSPFWTPKTISTMEGLLVQPMMLPTSCLTALHWKQSEKQQKKARRKEKRRKATFLTVASLLGMLHFSFSCNSPLGAKPHFQSHMLNRYEYFFFINSLVLNTRMPVYSDPRIGMFDPHRGALLTCFPSHVDVHPDTQNQQASQLHREARAWRCHYR